MLQKKIIVRHAPSVEKVADVFTKAFSSSRFTEMRIKLRVEDLSTLSLRVVVEE